MTTRTGVAVPLVDLVSQHAPIRAELLEAVERLLGHGQYILCLNVGEMESMPGRDRTVRHPSIEMGKADSLLTIEQPTVSFRSIR